MTWQLFSPDLPFLNQITVSQEKHGVWEHILPYAPLITAVISAGISTAGIIVTFNLALKARLISEQQKKIAQTKLEVDVFDKRFDVFNAYQEYYNKIVANEYKEKNEITNDLLIFQALYERSIFLFSFDDFEILNNPKDILHKMTLYRLERFDEDFDEDPEWEAMNCDFHEKNATMALLLKQYAPKIMSERAMSSTTDLASDHIPQSTGLKAFLKRLKRAVYGWSEPLQ
ncbi:hypothetical protein ACI01nite_25250 [Acetobacter cibinongensis]|uniref:Uncharacterized protein n=1 Tax=Acetobacter cibinongensis TaxID=146475 RepID=A0A0D6N6C3_9PROT|nr:hypothetical protein [Acetobacter cibinongensis]GAN61582.1 hypothetical protein Abci_046_015 [Acetobacter cibinongensis]GBQ17678.1 hypothetical protein AA0482_1981 [Acetobacter cibinongensis NRIC 0482]GEL59923.1 hypothetical protein ACI01nite_25250 [Acetobacter cibinongensis]